MCDQGIIVQAQIECNTCKMLTQQSRNCTLESMEPQQTIQTPPPQPQQPNITPQGKKISPKMILGFLILVLVIGGVLGVAWAGMGRGNNNDNQNEQNQTEDKFLAPYIVLYGAWQGENAVIYANDLSTGKEYEVAALPENVKKVTLISPTEILYIADTDGQDHGQSIKITDLTSGETSTIYSAIEEYGIDDYEVSPNGQYLATWEVKFLPNSRVLTGGNSRVATINKSDPTNTHIIYDEVATQAVHYPVGITNEGKVFLDTFLPNTTDGWAHGMSVSDISGTTKTDLPLVNGTYGTQPTMSPNGEYLAFGGYDGTKGPGTQVVSGYRQAVLTPNTVNLLNTQTNEIVTITTLSNQNVYPKMTWNQDNTLLLSVASAQENASGTFRLDIDNPALIANPNPNYENVSALESTSDVWLTGRYDPQAATIANLGSSYSQPYLSLTLTDKNGDTQDIDSSIPLMQFIDILPTSRVSKNILKNEIASSASDNNTATIQGDKLQLGNFTIKEELAPTREAQQSDPPTTPTPTPTNSPGGKAPRAPGGGGVNNPNPPEEENTDLPVCRDLANAQALAVCGPKPTPSPMLSAEDKAKYGKCFQALTESLKAQGLCYDSPLYLYGPEGMDVTASIKTPISNENIKGNGTYNLTLGKQGIFYHNNKSYTSLTFNYKPAIFVKPPKYGTVIPSSELENTVQSYAQSLGLNTRETNDLLTDLKTKVTKDYVFLSFYPQETSKYLLPIMFSPTPDTYINYVFYLKNLDNKESLNYSPKKPSFPSIDKRGTLTAVEISIIAE